MYYFIFIKVAKQLNYIKSETLSSFSFWLSKSELQQLLLENGRVSCRSKEVIVINTLNKIEND